MILDELQDIINENFVNTVFNIIKKVANYFRINLKQFTIPNNIKTFVTTNSSKLQQAKLLYNKLKTKKESQDLNEGIIQDFLGQDKVVIILVIFMFVIGMINPESAMDVKDFYDYSVEIAKKLEI